VTLLVHLRVLAIWRLRITVVGVTTGTVVRIVGRSILCHALRETRTVRAVLRSSRSARCSRLVPNRWQLRVRGLLAGYAYSLAHLSIRRCLRRATVMRNALLLRVLVHLSALAFVISLALSLLLLLFGLPFLADFFKLCDESQSYGSMNGRDRCQGERARVDSH
jgi:hypothetical protein